MLKTFWRKHRPALITLTASLAALGAAVGTGYALAQADPVPPASAVTPAPSGSGQLGRAPILETSPPVRAVPKRPPSTTWQPRRQPRKPRVTVSPTPSPSTSSSPAPEASPPPPETSEPAPEVSPTP